MAQLKPVKVEQHPSKQFIEKWKRVEEAFSEMLRDLEGVRIPDLDTWEALIIAKLKERGIKNYVMQRGSPGEPHPVRDPARIAWFSWGRDYQYSLYARAGEDSFTIYVSADWNRSYSR